MKNCRERYPERRDHHSDHKPDLAWLAEFAAVNSVLVGYQDAGVTDSTASLFEQIAVRASSGQRQDQNIVFQIVD